MNQHVAKGVRPWLISFAYACVRKTLSKLKCDIVVFHVGISTHQVNANTIRFFKVSLAFWAGICIYIDCRPVYAAVEDLH